MPVTFPSSLLTSPPLSPRDRWLPVLLLLLLAGVLFLPGLDTFGVYGWQEGQRLLVAREMNDRLSAARSTRESIQTLLLPTAHGTPYIAKPPVFLWAQILAARASGSNVELWHIRLVAALAALVGVLATFFAARIIFAPDPPPHHSPLRGLDGVDHSPRFITSASFWAGATLATGALYAHSARIGEVDILLACFCTIAIGAVAAAWRSHRVRRTTSLPAVLLATIACSLATMTKDPGVLFVALAGFGGIALHAAFAPPGTLLDTALLPGSHTLPFAARGIGPLTPCPSPTRFSVRRDIICSLVAGLVGGALACRSVDSPDDWLGVPLIGLACAFVALVASRLTEPVRLVSLLVAFSRTHPVIVLGLPIVLGVLWRGAVASIIGQDVARALVQQEIDDNLRPLIAEAPLNNLKAFAVGLTFASFASIFGIIWYIKDRPRLAPGLWQIVAWIIFPLIAFSLLGKGVQRYLTPMWPGVALLGGLTIASLIAANPRQRLLKPALASVVIALALGQSVYYVVGREKLRGRLSPRDFVAELRSKALVDLDRLVSINMSSPALSYYCGQRIEPVGDTGVNSSMSGGRALSFEEFAQLVRTHGVMFALIRQPRDQKAANRAPDSARAQDPARADPEFRSLDPADPRDRLRALSLRVEPLDPAPSASFRDSDNVEIRCYRVTP